MYQIFLIFFNVCFTVNTVRVSEKNASHLTDYSFLRLNGPNAGIISIKKDSRGFYIGVDFVRDDPNSNKTYIQNDYPVLLGLYTSETLLASSCSDFSHYDCKSFKCFPFDETTVSYPYFVASGVYATTIAYVDYSHWRLDADAVLADSCNQNSISIGKNTYGIIGMGIKGGSEYNFIESLLFSIHLEEDYSNGLLIFKKDFNYTTSEIPVVTIPTDKNWQADINGKIQVGNQSFSITSKLIFDLNTDAIGFPFDQYYAILTYLSDYGVACTGDASSQPSCAYHGVIKDLPTIEIINDSMQIPIVPQVYVKNGRNEENVTKIVLNMRALGTNYTGKSYVTPEYSNTIILDAGFMSNYYTVFEGETEKDNQRITLYPTKSFPSTSRNLVWVYITAGVVVLLIIFGFVFRRYYSGKKPPSNENASVRSALIPESE